MVSPKSKLGAIQELSEVFYCFLHCQQLSAINAVILFRWSQPLTIVRNHPFFALLLGLGDVSQSLPEAILANVQKSPKT